jgi:hypothetical protein
MEHGSSDIKYFRMKKLLFLLCVLVSLGSIGQKPDQTLNVYRIDSLYGNFQSVGDTSLYKPMVMNSNGKAKRMTYWPSGAAGGGDVSKVGTPVNNQVAVWTGDGTVEGGTDFTNDGSKVLITTALGVKNTSVDGATLMVSDANTTLGGTAQSTTVKILGTATGPNNLLHMNNNQATGRAGFILSESASGDWADNFMAFHTHGASFANNYYITNYPSKTSDAGWNYIVNQGTGVNGFAIVNNSAKPIVFGVNNAAIWQINTSGYFVPIANNNYDIGTSAERVRNLYVSGSSYTAGNIVMGAVTTLAASATNTFHLYNGTVPTASVTDGVLLYSEDVATSAELKVRDEAGNITVLGPHTFTGIPGGRSEEMAWAFYSERDGKYINVDMLKLARAIEKLTGEKLVYIGNTKDELPNKENK